MLRIAICDDEKDILECISNIVKSELKLQNIDYTIKEFNNSNELISIHEKDPFDVLFLDIYMPNQDGGFEISKIVRENSNRLDSVFIIFVTSKGELISDSMDYQPFNFVQKWSFEHLSSSLTNVIKKLLRHIKQYELITINCVDSKNVTLCVKEIIYIKSSDHYLYYYTANTEYKSRDNINNKEKYLEKYDFVRTHKSYLVNLKYIKIVDNHFNEIELLIHTIKGSRILLSRNYKKDFEEKYSKYKRSWV